MHGVLQMTAWQAFALGMMAFSMTRLADIAWPTKWFPWPVYVGQFVLGVVLYAALGAA